MEVEITTQSRAKEVCVRCRKRKRKCDGAKPTCSSCMKAGPLAECSYERGKSREQELATKLKELEARLDVVSHGSKGSEPAQEKSFESRISVPEIPSTDVLLAAASGLGSGISEPVKELTADWFKDDVIPIPVRDYLIAIFLKHAPQFHFDQNVPSLLSRLHLYQPSHPKYPHSSLMNAMYLAALFFLSSSVYPPNLQARLKCNPKEAEMEFLKKTRNALNGNLAMAENLLDYLLASSLLARYLCYALRIPEGHHEAAGAVRLAMACNLHIISNPNNLGSFPPSMIPPPKHLLEVCDRINAFWCVYIVDRGASLVSGLPTSIPDETITTVFPPIPQDSSNGGIPQFQYGTISSMYLEGNEAADTTYDTMHGVKAKGSALMLQVRSLVFRTGEQGIKEFQHTTPAFATDWLVTERALTKLIESLPSVPRLPPSASTITHDSALAELSMLQTVMRASLIQLHGLFASTSVESYSKVVAAAHEIVNVAKTLQNVSEIYWQVPIHAGWGNAGEIFYKEITRVRASGYPLEKKREYVIRNLRGDMELLRTMTNRLNQVFPLLPGTLKLIPDLLEKDLDVWGRQSAQIRSAI